MRFLVQASAIYLDTDARTAYGLVFIIYQKIRISIDLRLDRDARCTALYRKSIEVVPMLVHMPVTVR
ncbi:hypothetical protein BSU04_17755 [Caballeronia sordidicola]|uniref:Uncharacterized protein n=1 Tax=Caballeronia sordidicola TaxID=196367 RepID=A0A226X1S8_CABSO|nr:hypothetical protein BSU04_17755 [Caballeronia sordidicola]